MKRAMIAVIAALLLQAGAFAAEAGTPPDNVGKAVATLGTLCALIAVKAGFIGMAVWLHVQWPRACERVLEAYQTRGKRCFWVGFINMLAGLFVAALMIASGVLAPLGLLLAVSLLALATMGYAAVYYNLGLRLQAVDGPQSQTRAMALGGVIMELACLVPILGQILSAGILFRGAGASVLALMASRRKAPQTPAPEINPVTPPSEPVG